MGGVGLKNVVDPMVDDVFEFLLLVDHRLVLGVLRIESSHVHFLNLLLQSPGILGLGSWDKLTEGRFHDVFVVYEVMLVALVGEGDLVEAPHILILHFLLQGVVCTLCGLVLEVHVAEIGEVDVHFADSPQKLGAVEGRSGLGEDSCTCWAYLG